MQKQPKKNEYKIKKGALTIAAGLLAISMIGSTWAYWSQEKTTVNEFQTGKYSTKLVEDFDSTSAKDWMPGKGVNKDVTIKNEGNVPIFTKVVLNQKWIHTADGKELPLTFDGTAGKEYAALLNWGSDVVILSGTTAVSDAQIIQFATSGVTPATPSAAPSLGLSTVASTSAAKGKWLLVNSEPDANGNYTLYYMGTLEGGKSTPKVLDGVTMNPNVGAVETDSKTVWDKATQTWTTTTTTNSNSGYENSHYTLTVSMYTVQATQAAVKEMFTSANTSEQSVISYLTTLGMKEEDIDYAYDKTTTKKLYFEEKNGTMTYTPVRNSKEEWFMSHLAMVPGGSYTDTLDIENLSAKTFELYMQVDPINQSADLNELLGYISMKVYYDGNEIYTGTAKGSAVSGGKNLLDAVLLGTYEPKKTGKIKVELSLSKDTPIAYSDKISKINWKFMVNEKVADKEETKTETTPTTAVKTGDTSNWYRYLGFMAVALTGFVLCMVGINKQKKNMLLEEQHTISTKED